MPFLMMAVGLSIPSVVSSSVALSVEDLAMTTRVPFAELVVDLCALVDGSVDLSSAADLIAMVVEEFSLAADLFAILVEVPLVRVDLSQHALLHALAYPFQKLQRFLQKICYFQVPEDVKNNEEVAYRWVDSDCAWES